MTNSNHIPGDVREEALSNVPAEEKARLSEVWDWVATADESPNINNDEIDQVRQKLSSFARSHNDSKGARRRKLQLVSSRRTWMSIAATLLLGAIGFGWWSQPVQVHAPEGQQVAVNLPDGSIVELNSGSSLTYPRRFGDARQVYLDGEAFFEVAHDAGPFTLTTFNANIEVLGTQFNVKAWRNSMAPSTSVSLTKGSVLFSTHEPSQQGVVMKPGQRRSLPIKNNEISPPDTVTQAYATAWKEGDLAYRDEWLGIILEDIERRFAIDIDLKAEELLQKEFTFIYRQPKEANSVINSLCEGLGLRYSQTARGVAIYRATGS